MGRARYPARDKASDHRRLRRQQRCRAFACGSASCKTWPTNSASPSRSVICPPGTSKWNKIEHRLFSFITQNWRGKPLVSHQAIVQLIAATTTDTGLKVRSEIDRNTYPAGVKVTDAEMDAINIHRHEFHGDWNYTIRPQASVRSDSS